MKQISIIMILAGLLLGSCASLKVTSDKDTTVDFNKFKSFEYYGWEDESDQLLNRFDKERIENAFAEEFNKRGLQYAESGGDLVVTLYVVTEQKNKTTAHTNHMGGYGGFGYGDYYDYGPGWGWSGGYSTTTYSQYDYEVGTLICSVYDKEAKQLIWESTGVGTVDYNPQTGDKKVPKYVAQIMSKYPVETAR